MYGPQDLIILNRVFSGIGGVFGLIIFFAVISILRYSIHTKIAARKAARQERLAQATASVTPPERAVFIPQTEGAESTEGRGSSVRLTHTVSAENPPPADRTRPRPEPVPAQPSGSMEYQSTEGIGTSAYQSPLFSAPPQDARFKTIDRKLPADRLRAAIVMSEILAKPVALREKPSRAARG